MQLGRERLQRLLDLQHIKRQATYQSFIQTYGKNPVAFVHDVIKWPTGSFPAPYQDEILSHFVTDHRLCIRGPHGLGKTALMSWGVLWFTLTHDLADLDWKIPTTASVWRQLTHFLWPEIRKWAGMIDWAKVGRPPLVSHDELLELSIKLPHGEAFALASNKPEQIEGAHAPFLLYVFDEAKTIVPDTWDAAEGAFSTGDTYWLACSTPGEPAGRFYDIQSRKPGFEGWWVRHVTIDECIKAGRIKPDWVDLCRAQWGQDSAVFQNRVLGEFASSSDTGVIPLAWVEQANQRWVDLHDKQKQALAGNGHNPRKFTGLGVDVAWMGEDKTVLAFRYGDVIERLEYYTKSDTMQTAGYVVHALNTLGGYAIIDVVGVGAGVYDRIKEQGFSVTPFQAGNHTDATDKSGQIQFVDVRAAAWWGLRELLDPSSGSLVALPPDNLLIGDLTAVQWKVTSTGKVRIESKDDLRERIGRSTDAGDAVVQAFYHPAQTPSDWLAALKRETERRKLQEPFP